MRLIQKSQRREAKSSAMALTGRRGQSVRRLGFAALVATAVVLATPAVSVGHFSFYQYMLEPGCAGGVKAKKVDPINVHFFAKANSGNYDAPGHVSHILDVFPGWSHGGGATEAIFTHEQCPTQRFHNADDEAVFDRNHIRLFANWDNLPRHTSATVGDAHHDKGATCSSPSPPFFRETHVATAYMRPRDVLYDAFRGRRTAFFTKRRNTEAIYQCSGDTPANADGGVLNIRLRKTD